MAKESQISESPEDAAADFNDQLVNRRAAMQAWRDDGVAPFGGRFDGVIPLSEARALYVEGDDTVAVTVAGRVTARREMGKSVFADLRSGTDRLQIYAQKNVLGDDGFGRFKRLDLGDIIGVSGTLFKTRTEEITVKVSEYTLLSKALRPLPEKFHGLQDVERCYRQRYLDLISNPATAERFRKRVRIIAEIRQFLDARAFIEVETPMLQPIAGGAAARPFKTHYHSLSCEMYMRIAPELYLKRLLVGGYDRVFELNRNFRNEGLSRRHNPEFTMLELYQAYSDCEGMMQLIEAMITTVAAAVNDGLTVPGKDETMIDLTAPWRRVSYRDLVCERAGSDWFDKSPAERVQAATDRGLQVSKDMTDVEVTSELFEKEIEPSLLQPTFVTRLPVELVPLAKQCDDDPELVDVYELIINGQEMSPGYSELNDPLIQRQRFEDQLEADAEEGRIDEDFLEALEYGMPPAGGLGLGIDRLVMLLTGAESIRDVILFPQLKPKS